MKVTVIEFSKEDLAAMSRGPPRRIKGRKPRPPKWSSILKSEAEIIAKYPRLQRQGGWTLKKLRLKSPVPAE